MKNESFIKKIPAHIWILTIIVFAGIFLRAYHFHDWLKFREDQARDANLVSQVVDRKAPWPVLGPYMSYSGEGDHVETNSFHLGPIYYYFQIISAKIFGDYADKLAYPDLFLGILTIPLFYLFLGIYFEESISLGLTGLYAISSYFVQYSRFAWNTNLIPFFVLLFLFSSNKFLKTNEKKNWIWPIILGVAVGVGIQLHVIVLALFALVTIFIMLFSLKKNIGAWKKWILVFLIICLLNTGQIISEIKTNFGNTKILFHPKYNSNEPELGKLALIKNDIDCHLEANSYFLSSFGSSNCTYDFISPAAYTLKNTKNMFKKLGDLAIKLPKLAAVIFSILGYFLLVLYSKNETEKRRKYFLRLILLYVLAAFLIMIPLSKSTFNDLRYLTSVFFVPFVLLGLLIEFIRKKFQKRYFVLTLISAIFLLLIYTNGSAIFDQISALLSGSRTCSSHSTTLGELEAVAENMISNAGGKKIIYYGGDKALRVVDSPLAYILERRGIDPVTIGPEAEQSREKDPAYIISCKSGSTDNYPYNKIGDIYVYRVSN